MLSLRSALPNSGSRSLRQYAASLGTVEGRVAAHHLMVADRIHRHWAALGGMADPGPPLSDVVRRGDGSYARDYTAGTISQRLTGGGEPLPPPDREVAYQLDVRLAGVQCVRESDHDQSTSHDEPYLIVSAINTNSTQTALDSISPKVLGPFDGTDTGDWIGIGAELWSGANPNRVQVVVLVMEEDQGQESQIRDKVEKALKEQLHNAAAAFAAATGSPESPDLEKDSLAQAAVKGLSFAYTKVFGLGDDRVGVGSFPLEYAQARLDPPPRKEHHGEKYRHVMRIDGGDAGAYDIYLDWVSRDVVAPNP